MFKQADKYAGIMLIEFMVAMLISLLLLGLLGTTYLAAEKNQAAQAACFLVQENGRLATQLLGRNIHQAGNVGCARLAADFPLSSALQDGLAPHTKIQGTDKTLTLRGGSLASGYLAQAMQTPSVLYVSSSLPVTVGDSLMVSDCQTAAIFQVKSIEKVSATLQKIVSVLPLPKRYNMNAEVHTYEVNTYFVAATRRVDAAGAVIYALYRKNLHQHSAELVEGIEAMQFRYDVLQGDRRVTMEASQVQDWAKVMGVSIELHVSATNNYPLHKIRYSYAALL